jgi:hypothetical protein
MSTLSGKNINETYDGLLKTSNNEALPQTGRIVIQDGLGNDTALSIGRAGEGISIDGPIEGITGGGGTVTAKEFNIVYLSEYTEGSGFDMSFLIEGETCNSITLEFFQGSSSLPIYTHTINNPVNGVLYQGVADSYPFVTGNYTIFVRAEFADNTKAYDMGKAAIISEPTKTLNVLNYSVNFITDPSQSEYISRYNQFYVDDNDYYNSQRADRKVGIRFFFEIDMTVEVGPYDYFEESALELLYSVPFYSYFGSYSTRQNVELSYNINPSAPQIRNYHFFKVSERTYRIITPILYRHTGATSDYFFINNFNLLSTTEQVITSSFRSFIGRYVVDRLNEATQSGVTVLYSDKHYINLSNFETPNGLHLNNFYFYYSSSDADNSDVVFNFNIQNVLPGSQILFEIVDANTQQTLWSQNHTLTTNYLSGKTFFSTTPLTVGNQYEGRMTVEFIDGTTQTDSYTLTPAYADCSITINSYSSTEIDVTASFVNWIHNYYNDLQFILEDSATLDVIPTNEVFASTRESDYSDAIVTSYQNQPSYVQDVTTQTINFKVVPLAPLSAGQYTLRVYGSDWFWQATGNADKNYDLQTFIIS